MPVIDRTDLGMIIRKDFESKNESDEFFELLLNQLISKFGEGSREGFCYQSVYELEKWQPDSGSLDQ